MTESAYRQLLELNYWVLSLTLRSESIYKALAEAADGKLKRELQEQDLVTARIEHVTAILQAISGFVPDLHIM